LHAIALRAEANAVASLTIDGADFTGDTPFYAFTERRDGRHHTSWFDPLRGQSEPEPQLAALLSRYLGNAIDFEDFILGDSRQRLTQGQLLGTLVAREHGALITPGLLRPWVPWTPPPPSGLERLLILMFAAVPVGLTWFTRSFSERPTTLELAMRPAGLAALLSGVLALFPFVSPGGRVIPWPLRVAWFVGSPFAFVWLDFTLRGTS
jgi:hypothetical protein